MKHVYANEPKFEIDTHMCISRIASTIVTSKIDSAAVLHH